jgi:hypothetical protein
VEDIEFLKGEFVVWDSQTYRVKSYLHEYELFSINDKKCESVIARIKRESVEDSYTAFANCDYYGIRYPAYGIRNNRCYFKKIVNHSDEYLVDIPLAEMNEVWIQRNRSNCVPEKVEVYLNEKCVEQKPSDQIFYLEEMANGNIMTSHLDKNKDIEQTIKDLENLYGNRIQIDKPDLYLLMVDYFISRIKIDSHHFCMDYDYGIITISPENESGNKYISEIVDCFNR